MSEQQTIDQIKTRLNKFIEDIDHVNPDEVRVEDIDDWSVRSIRREGKTSFKISLIFNY